MNGIKIFGKKQKKDYGKAQKLSRIDYGFHELIEPVRDGIKDYYWILDNQDFKYFSDYENKYDELIIEESQLTRLTRKGFIPDYAKYIIQEWGQIYGIKDKLSIATINLNKDFIKKTVDIYFSCIDGAYWEVYARNAEIIEKIRKEFPFSKSIALGEKKY
ncbi:MAG: hypothetical protein JW927_02570 [Deltaproteobacteria bacterium]|nr:hypothetical protein [Deltaproteobacteria bacterium]